MSATTLLGCTRTYIYFLDIIVQFADVLKCLLNTNYSQCDGFTDNSETIESTAEPIVLTSDSIVKTTDVFFLHREAITEGSDAIAYFQTFQKD